MRPRRSGSRTSCAQQPHRRRAASRRLRASLRDVPYFLADGPQLGTGDGTELAPLWSCRRTTGSSSSSREESAKTSTARVFAAFDVAKRRDGYDDRRGALLARDSSRFRRPRDLAALPPNDLDVLARHREAAPARRVPGRCHRRAARRLRALPARRHVRARRSESMSAEGRTWLTSPAWYR